VDAFSSDSIPVHLITKEALGVYLRHVKPDGIVAFHVSNRFLNLVPVVAQIAAEHGAHAMLVSDKGQDSEEDYTTTDWVLVSRERRALEAPEIASSSPEPAEVQEGWRTWTDDYSYKSCTGVTNMDAYADRTTMPGYYQGQLAWGSEPYTAP